MKMSENVKDFLFSKKKIGPFSQGNPFVSVNYGMWCKNFCDPSDTNALLTEKQYNTMKKEKRKQKPV